MKKNKNYPYHDVKKFESIKEMLKLAVEEAGDKNAFMFKDADKSVKAITYNEFLKDINSLGTALSYINALDKHIAVIGENSYKWITVYMTVLQSRSVCVPIDKELPIEDVINVLEHSDSEVLFYSKKFEKHIPLMIEKLPSIKYFIGFDIDEKSKSQNVLSYDKFIALGEKKLDEGDTSYTAIEPYTDEMRVIVYTSGTTGKSKGVMITEKGLVSIVYYGLQISTVYTKCLSVLPLHHTYEAAGLLFTIHKHGCMCINENMKSVLKNLKLYKPDYIYVVPAFVELFYSRIWANAEENHKKTLLKMMIKLSNFLRVFNIDIRKKLFSSIHEVFGGNMIKIVSGGAPLRAELGVFFDSIGIDLINGYGITECAPLISANRDYFNDPSTVGVLMPSLELKFDNIAEDGTGEICVKGDNVMLGYYKDEERTNQVLIDGWFYTGDYGKLNDKEQLIITGRKKNLIVLRNGKNVFPEEIEDYIMGISYVKEVVVSGIKNENGEEDALRAEIFLDKEAVDKLEIKNISEKLRNDINSALIKLPLYKQINDIVLRDTEFVKTTTKKIKR